MIPTSIPELIPWLLAQLPLAALPVIALYIMYNDSKQERADSRKLFENLLVQVTLTTTYVQLLAAALSVQLPSKAQMLSDLDTIKRRSESVENKP